MGGGYVSIKQEAVGREGWVGGGWEGWVGGWEKFF